MSNHAPDFDESREPDPGDGPRNAGPPTQGTTEPDTKGKPGAGAVPINDPDTPPPAAEPDVDAGSQ